MEYNGSIGNAALMRNSSGSNDIYNPTHRTAPHHTVSSIHSILSDRISTHPMPDYRSLSDRLYALYDWCDEWYNTMVFTASRGGCRPSAYARESAYLREHTEWDRNGEVYE